MAFSQKKIYVVIALTVIALVGVIVIQFFWIDSAFKTEEDQFNRLVFALQGDIENSLDEDPDFRRDIIRFANICDISQQHEYTQEKAVLEDQLRTTIDSLFQERNLNINYEFGVVRHDRRGVEEENRILLSSSVVQDSSFILNTTYRSCTSELAGAAHINLFFPDRDYYIARQIGGMLALSVLFILVIVGCFAYTILTIRKQKRLADMKNDFINNMTHEFKTPIFSISLASKALGKSGMIKKSPKLDSYLNLIQDENRRLKSQVDKVLQIALIDSESFKLEKKEVDLHEQIRKVVKSFELAVEERKGKINLQLDAEKYLLFADPTHLSNIIYNLIDNAVKYSKEIPEILVSTKDTTDGISFCVKDNGVGMDTDAQRYIFDKFYRAQSGDIHDVKGFGLGLSYVKNIVDAHNGWINLKSKLNQGSEFTVTLPGTA